LVQNLFLANQDASKERITTSAVEREIWFFPCVYES
jgi:hypothetical protein